jgi:hypothetical protein
MKHEKPKVNYTSKEHKITNLMYAHDQILSATAENERARNWRLFNFRNSEIKTKGRETQGKQGQQMAIGLNGYITECIPKIYIKKTN